MVPSECKASKNRPLLLEMWKGCLKSFHDDALQKDSVYVEAFFSFKLQGGCFLRAALMALMVLWEQKPVKAEAEQLPHPKGKVLNIPRSPL